jgi:hypothetical protein
MSKGVKNGGQEQRKPSPIWWQSIIAVSPIAVALGYIMAYLYELGYCNAFGIPTEFISIDKTNVLISVSKVFLSTVALFWVAYVFVTMTSKPKKRGPIRRRFILLMIIVLIYIAFAIDYPIARREWYYIVPILIIFIFLLFISPAITHRNVKGYRKRLIAQDKINAATNPINYIERHIGRSTAIILLLLLPLIALPYLNGETDATEQENFLVPSTYQSSVVLRIYGDNLICAELDPQGSKLTGRLFMISMDDEPRPYLRLQKVGRLVPKN